jgi:MHS family alpha-ketoglutarate permease-like MFS transporter
MNQVIRYSPASISVGEGPRRGTSMNETSMAASGTPGALAGGAIPGATSAQDTRRRIIAIFGGSIGNLVEWYDWYVYATFSLYFAKAFFPAGDQTAQLLNTAAVFAAGFLIRPIGSWALGRYADRYGRKSSLQFSIMLMCAGSLIIAITPTYATIGSWAAFVLVFARLLQGFSLGGERGGSDCSDRISEPISGEICRVVEHCE